MTSPTDIPEGYTLIETELLHQIAELARPAHFLADLYEEVIASLQAGQPHSAAMVKPKAGGLQLVNGQGKPTGQQMEFVGVAVQKDVLADSQKIYAGLTHREEFLSLLAEAGLISMEDPDGEEE